jgi:hypothetical protein
MPKKSDKPATPAGPPAGNNPPPAPRKLHVVVHGLVGIRISEESKTVELHVPDVGTEHLYRIGPYDDPKVLEPGHDYVLKVSCGKYNPDLGSLKKTTILMGCKSDNLTFRPHGARAKLLLPWPENIQGVRTLIDKVSPKPLFTLDGKTLDPRGLEYILFLTYVLKKGEQPRIEKGGHVFWSSEALNEHTRIHLFADPPAELSNTKYQTHVSHAYDAFNRQLFHPPATLLPDLPADPNVRMRFRDGVDIPEIPAYEQTDLSVEMGAGRRQGFFSLGCTGNCLSPMIFD